MTQVAVLVTGANGFVGTRLCQRLVGNGRSVRPVMRKASEGAIQIVGIDGETDWSIALSGIDVVVHVAARVHVMNDYATDSLAEFRKVNVAGTLNLARQAVAAGVRRFVFVSTIGVHGSTTVDLPFTEDSPVAPNSDYALSKWEAEQGLREIEVATGLEVVIVRPPLVYGFDAPGNFRTLSRWLRARRPLPFGCVTSNRRSYVAIDNLVSFLMLCTTHPAAAGQSFVIDDGEDVSMRVFAERIAQAQGCSARLLSVPVPWMRFAACLLGKSEVADRLFGSLRVDSSKARRLLGWQPVVGMEQQLRKHD